MASTGHGLFAKFLGETVVPESQIPSDTHCLPVGRDAASHVLGASDFLSPLTSAGFKPVT